MSRKLSAPDGAMGVDLCLRRGSPRGGEVFAEVVYKAFQFVDAGFKSPFVGGESIMVDLQPIVDVWIDGLRSKLGS